MPMTKAAKEVEAIAFFLKPYALDLSVMDQAQRERVPLALALNLADAMRSSDEVLKRRAIHASAALTVAGATAIWSKFVERSLVAEARA